MATAESVTARAQGVVTVSDRVRGRLILALELAR
jgi:hypothetical protein